jgi:diketogulonate reductase-like aldo/keto reductase
MCVDIDDYTHRYDMITHEQCCLNYILQKKIQIISKNAQYSHIHKKKKGILYN